MNARIVEELAKGGVDFVIIGGLAALAHGAARPTFDVDVCYARTEDNLERLIQTVAPWHPKLRGAPADLPFLWDAETLRKGLFTLETERGSLDLLGEVAGVGTYDQVRARSSLETVFGQQCWVISLPDLITSKYAGGRIKDKEALLELEALWEAQRDEE